MGASGSVSSSNSESSLKTPSSSNMSLFRRKQSKAGHTRLQHQLHTAKHAPDSVVDVSECDLVQVPVGLYALVKVLLKQVLLLHSNRLTSLKESGTYEEFAKTQQTLRVLDAHDNEIKEIPIQLRFFTKLQVLDLSGNRISVVPDDIGKLTSLQNLKLNGNQISNLPSSLGNCSSLRSLDVKDNQITHLPKSLANLRCIETLSLDNQQMIYPPPDVCAGGASSVMQFLCREAGVEYQVPCKSVLPLLAAPESAYLRGRSASETHMTPRLKDSDRQMSWLADTARQYERAKQQKQEEQAKIQQVMLEARAQHAACVAHNVSTRQRLLGDILQQQQDIDRKIMSVQQQKDMDKQNLLGAIDSMEKHANTLVSQILATNRDILWAEERMELEERRRMEEEQWYKVKWEEYERLRKAEIEKAMEVTIAQNYSLDELRGWYETQKGNALARWMQDESDQADNVDAVLKHKDNMMRELMTQMMHDQQFQKEAVLALMEQRDARTNRLNSQIDMIHKELAQLSMLERKNKDIRVADEQEFLEEQRHGLTRLLMQLMEEKQSRTEELQKRLIEMEKAREDSRTDYWMLQYQKLLDSKPQPLLEKERALEMEVCKVLAWADANEFLPTFAKHNITADILPTLSEEDLQKMGIYQVGKRKSILRAVESYLDAKKTSVPWAPSGKAKTPQPEGAVAASQERRPSAPPLPARFEIECVVCMADGAVVNLLFVPCGHVCCCVSCGSALKECPLCRAAIEQKIDLEASVVAPTAPSADR